VNWWPGFRQLEIAAVASSFVSFRAESLPKTRFMGLEHCMVGANVEFLRPELSLFLKRYGQDAQRTFSSFSRSNPVSPDMPTFKEITFGERLSNGFLRALIRGQVFATVYTLGSFTITFSKRPIRSYTMSISMQKPDTRSMLKKCSGHPSIANEFVVHR
jgi:hypothetical protein